MQRMYFVTYTTMPWQEGAHSVLSQQHCWVRRQLLGQELNEWRVLEAAQVADAQAATLRKFKNDHAKLQLLEAASHGNIPAWEG